MEWPDNGSPALRFTFNPLQEFGSFKNQKTYTSEVSAKNLWSKTIDHAEFVVLVFDAEQARVGEGYIRIASLAPGETSKFAVTFSTIGVPTRMRLEPRDVPAELGPPKPPHVIGVTIYSVPPGALLRVDGKEVGNTPIQVQLGDGQHVLEFSKEGFAVGHFTHNIGPNDVSGGNVTVELAGLNHDMVELRDGSTIVGDVQSVDAAHVVVTVAGEDRKIERNKVQKILLIQREAPAPQPNKQKAQPPK